MLPFLVAIIKYAHAVFDDPNTAVKKIIIFSDNQKLNTIGIHIHYTIGYTYNI